jgi:hypothetical protein
MADDDMEEAIVIAVYGSLIFIGLLIAIFSKPIK